jgi:hypothetical protein
MSKITEIHPDLRLTLELNENIEEIHFTKTGAHYFNVHELMTENGKKTGKFYGWLKTEVKEVMIKDPRGKAKPTLKLINVENPIALIVETLQRDEVLALPDMELEEIEQRNAERVNPALANQLTKRKYTPRKTNTKQKAEA